MFERIKPILVLLACGVFSLYLAFSVMEGVDAMAGIIAGVVAALLCFLLILPEQHDQRFLLRLFAGALALRWAVSYVIYSRHLQSIGPDAATYDFFGNYLSQTWQGLMDSNWSIYFLNMKRSGWGMYYYVGAVYYLAGQSPLAIQLINGALGALTSVLVYKITLLVYPQLRVARLAGLLAAATPSMVLWSAQGIKEAPIMLCLSLCAFLALKLCRKFDLLSCAGLIVALFCLYSLRHYVFYIAFAAVAGTLLFSTMKFTAVRALQGFVFFIVLGFTFAYVGADKVARQSLDLKRIQAGREWSARAANSGYGGDVDITDAREALTFLPVGIVYVLFAPFPWMVKNLGQALTLPEMFLWLAATPLLIRGYWFALRRRLLETLPICVFTFGLTVVYALFQTNAGTAHRQRTQLYVFFVIFISIGWEQWREAKRSQAKHLHPQLAGLSPLSTPASYKRGSASV